MKRRPDLTERKFSSSAVEKITEEVCSSLDDPELSKLFENCFTNTLDTTTEFRHSEGKPDTFVITGDIDAMWLRDSSAQVFPYLQFCREDSGLRELIKGVINRQVKCILTDPYANAFLLSGKSSQWQNDLTEMKPGVYERKWELDSLCYHIRLSYHFWKTTGDISCFDEAWFSASELILKTLREQQRKESNGPYKFSRVTSWSTDTVPGNGYGNPMKPVGLIASVFRPSDDACIFPFNIPSNFFAVLSLRQLSEMHLEIFNNKKSAAELNSLADEVREAIYKYAVEEKTGYGKIFAYETDGFGNKLFMDDANIPGLLSLPYLGCLEMHDEIYRNTRRFILSSDNPYFFKGKAAEGIGSPHTLSDRIWHLGIIMRALTANNKDEIKTCIDYLKRTHAGTYFMHESFNKDNPNDFTRGWFAWANSLFGELILKVINQPQSSLT